MIEMLFWCCELYTRMAKSELYTRNETNFTHDFEVQTLHTI